MPRRNTDKLLLKEPVKVKVCRTEGKEPVCSLAGQLMLGSSEPGVFTEPLPAQLAAGKPRALSYFVELENARGRSAGPSNLARVVAGEAPAAVAGLRAQVSKAGVVLRWQSSTGDSTAVRLDRRLLTPQPKHDPLGAAAEPAEQDLLVSERVAEGRALDRTAQFGEVYEYRAQRVARVSVEGETVELAGGLSEPIRVEVRDVFPPDVPAGLAAVATAPENGAAVDLNWQPNTEPDLAGYIVYRNEGDGAWQRVSPAKPVATPVYHDAAVQPGHTYRYTVSAVDQGGHESKRSAEAEENVPAN